MKVHSQSTPDFFVHNALKILCSNNYKQNRQFVTHKFVSSDEQTVNKALSDLFIALLLHKFDNDYCQKVSGGMRVYAKLLACISREISVGTNSECL